MFGLKPVPFKDCALLFLELWSTEFAVISVHQRGMEITVNGVCGQLRLASSLVGPLFDVKAHSRSLRYPGFPVEVGRVGELHAAFLTESRTRGRWGCRVAGNPGTLRSG